MNTQLYSIRVYVSSILFLLYSFVVQAQQDIAVIKQNDKYGLIDNRGKVLLPCIYDELAVSCSDLILCKQGDKYGFIDRTGRTQITFKYDDAGVFYNDTTWVKKEGKVGFIDRNGTLFIDCRYEQASIFSEGMGGFKKNGKWGFLNSKGEVVVPPKYEQVYRYNEGYAVVINQGRYGLLDKGGTEVVPLEAYRYLDYVQGHQGIFVGLEFPYKGKYDLLKIQLTKIHKASLTQYKSIAIMPFAFYGNSECAPVHDSEFIIFEDTIGKRGVLNSNFIEIIKGYDHINYLSPRLFLCRDSEKKKEHILDSLGRILGDYSEYEEVKVYSEGKIIVRKNGKYGVIGFDKRKIIDFKYDELSRFDQGVAMANYKGSYYLINAKGKFLSKKLDCDRLQHISYPYMIVIRKGEYYGAVDYSGKVILPTKYEALIDFYTQSLLKEPFY
jgi:hypothetical protein